mmetsp:Transcript_48200/g.145605  ORF Transcript_48200/g.145605 Transcript_48200/m.145605 type:complete len:398 (+) Transcript_48200:331-1524(+)
MRPLGGNIHVLCICTIGVGHTSHPRVDKDSHEGKHGENSDRNGKAHSLASATLRRLRIRPIRIFRALLLQYGSHLLDRRGPEPVLAVIPLPVVRTFAARVALGRGDVLLALAPVGAEGVVAILLPLLGLSAEHCGGVLAMLPSEGIPDTAIARVLALPLRVSPRPDAFPTVGAQMLHLLLGATYFVPHTAVSSDEAIGAGAVHKARVSLDGEVEFSTKDTGNVGVDPVPALPTVFAVKSTVRFGATLILAEGTLVACSRAFASLVRFFGVALSAIGAKHGGAIRLPRCRLHHPFSLAHSRRAVLAVPSRIPRIVLTFRSGAVAMTLFITVLDAFGPAEAAHIAALLHLHVAGEARVPAGTDAVHPKNLLPPLEVIRHARHVLVRLGPEFALPPILTL